MVKIENYICLSAFESAQHFVVRSQHKEWQEATLRQDARPFELKSGTKNDVTDVTSESKVKERSNKGEKRKWGGDKKK